MMYASDYDETMMSAYLGNARDGAPTEWPDLLDPYVKNAQVFSCPSEHWNINLQVYQPVPLSYGINYTATGYGRGGYKLSEFTRPAETILLADSGPHWCTNLTSVCVGHTKYITWHRKVDDYTRHHVYLRHNGTANVAFFDGHAKAENEGFVTNSQHFQRVW
jgi:prepilin-type processing-associated H-X9-DG protein